MVQQIVYLLFMCVCVQWCSTRLDYNMSNMVGAL